MKTLRILIVLCLQIMFLSDIAYCQVATDSLSIAKINGKEVNRWYKSGQINKIERQDLMRHGFAISSQDTILTFKEASALMSTNMNAQELLKDAHLKRITGDILFTGYSLYVVLFNLININHTIGLVPVLVLVCAPAVPIIILGVSAFNKSYKLAQESVHIFNSSKRSAWNLPNPEIRFGFTGSGIGMRINF